MHALLNRGDDHLPIQWKKGRLDARERLRGLANQIPPTCLGKIFVNTAVQSKQMNLISGAVSQNPQQECRLDLSIQTGCDTQLDQVLVSQVFFLGLAQEHCTRTTGVDNDHDVTVAFGTPRAHNQIF